MKEFVTPQPKCAVLHVFVPLHRPPAPPPSSSDAGPRQPAPTVELEHRHSLHDDIPIIENTQSEVSVGPTETDIALSDAHEALTRRGGPRRMQRSRHPWSPCNTEACNGSVPTTNRGDHLPPTKTGTPDREEGRKELGSGGDACGARDRGCGDSCSDHCSGHRTRPYKSGRHPSLLCRQPPAHVPPPTCPRPPSLDRRDPRHGHEHAGRCRPRLDDVDPACTRIWTGPCRGNVARPRRRQRAEHLLGTTEGVGRSRIR